LAEVQTATEVKEGILDEVLMQDSAQILDRVVAGGGSVCEACNDASLNKARTLASFTEIGRLSIAEAGARLEEFNVSVCGHIGSAAMGEVDLPELVAA
jgi:hypothetical protein